MSRVEHIGDCTLYLADCMDVLPTLGKVDALVCDPPYGMNLDADFSGMKNKFKGSNGGNKYKNIIGDDAPFDPTPFLGLAKNIVLFGADYFSSKLPCGGSYSVWDKRLDESADKMFGSCFEMMWFYPARKKEIIRHKWAGIFGTEKEDNPERVHPTQKPIGLMIKTIERLPKCQTILDPFMGSGTTGVACVKMGRKFIGIEREPEYFEIACKRIREAYAQPDMFVEPPKVMKQDSML